MEKQPMEKRKVYGTIIGVAIFVVFVIGATYAWFTWSSNPTNISGTSGCFEIEYAKGTEITGGIAPSTDYTGGRITTATMNIKSSCTTKGVGTISLTTNQDSTVDFTTGAVKYAVFEGNLTNEQLGTASPISEGVINTTNGETIHVAENLALTKTPQTYTIVIWIDVSLASSLTEGATYGGYIHASATQIDGVDASTN